MFDKKIYIVCQHCFDMTEEECNKASFSKEIESFKEDTKKIEDEFHKIVSGTSWID